MLPRTEHKSYQLLLHYAQQQQVLYVASIKPLNMETALAVCRVIDYFVQDLKGMHFFLHFSDSKDYLFVYNGLVLIRMKWIYLTNMY